jgi:preprotein translocase subunit YajC
MSLLFLQQNLSLMAQGAGGNSLLQLLPILAIMGIFYVLLILPAQRRQKKTQEMINALKNGDKVVTTGGLFGTIVGIEGDSIQLRIADQVKVRSCVPRCPPCNQIVRRSRRTG